MKYWMLLMLVLLSAMGVFAQERVLEVQFVAHYNNVPLLLKTNTHQFQEKEIVFTRLKYYITNIELYCNNKPVWKETNSHHLIDQEVNETTKITLSIPKKLRYDQIKYQLGVDSLTNVSGAMGGDLDPTKGMYWAWNSGYINFKLEGIYKDCPTRKNKFQFHIGGYAGHFATVQHLEHKIKKRVAVLVVVRVDQFLDQLNLVEQHSLMRPSLEAVEFSKKAASIFSVKK